MEPVTGLPRLLQLRIREATTGLPGVAAAAAGRTLGVACRQPCFQFVCRLSAYLPRGIHSTFRAAGPTVTTKRTKPRPQFPRLQSLQSSPSPRQCL